MSLALQIAAGIGLASCAGLRAFLPLLAVGAAGRLGWIDLNSGFTWLESTPALVILGTAVLVEVVADKVPLVDHALDAAGLFVKPIAGALVMASTLSDADPLAAVLLALVLGSPLAGGVHLVKAKTRLVSTVTTLGHANPAQSAIEDAACVGGCAACLTVPVVFVTLLILCAAALLWLRRRRRLAAVVER
jgi:hypothetical protein